jgi:hypothetical protein
VSDYERWLLELWHGSFDLADEIIAADFSGHWPDREVAGREELVALIRDTRAMFGSLAFTLEMGPFVDGEFVIARWSGVGTDPDMRLLGHDLLRVRDGRFAEYWVVSWTG